MAEVPTIVLCLILIQRGPSTGLIIRFLRNNVKRARLLGVDSNQLKKQ